MVPFSAFLRNYNFEINANQKGKLILENSNRWMQVQRTGHGRPSWEIPGGGIGIEIVWSEFQLTADISSTEILNEEETLCSLSHDRDFFKSL